ncbi:unnamed protein product, partial [Amoebophrya sp. A25]
SGNRPSIKRTRQAATRCRWVDEVPATIPASHGHINDQESHDAVCDSTSVSATASATEDEERDQVPRQPHAGAVDDNTSKSEGSSASSFYHSENMAATHGTLCSRHNINFHELLLTVAAFFQVSKLDNFTAKILEFLQKLTDRWKGYYPLATVWMIYIWKSGFDRL